MSLYLVTLVPKLQLGNALYRKHQLPVSRLPGAGTFK